MQTYTSAQVAEITGLSVMKIQNIAKRQRIGRQRAPKCTRFFTEADIFTLRLLSRDSAGNPNFGDVSFNAFRIAKRGMKYKPRTKPTKPGGGRPKGSLDKKPHKKATRKRAPVKKSRLPPKFSIDTDAK